MLLKKILFALLVKPLVFVIIGLNIRHRQRLPEKGPAIIVANHNSHLDTLVLMSLFKLKLLPKVRPVAASDYFLNKGIYSWMACNLIDIIPLDRKLRGSIDEQFNPIYQALDNNEIIIIFPEGSRGEAEHLSHFKRGIAVLAKQYPKVPITPIFLHGLGMCLPKGEGIFVPFICDVIVGEDMFWQSDTKSFVAALEQEVQELAKDITSTPWI